MKGSVSVIVFYLALVDIICINPMLRLLCIFFSYHLYVLFVICFVNSVIVCIYFCSIIYSVCDSFILSDQHLLFFSISYVYLYYICFRLCCILCHCHLGLLIVVTHFVTRLLVLLGLILLFCYNSILSSRSVQVLQLYI